MLGQRLKWSTQQTGRTIAPKSKQPHMSYVSSAELRPCRIGKHFMEPRGHDEILLRKILYFVGGTGGLAQ